MLSVTDLFTPATADEWTSTLLQNCTILGLQVTAWQAGGVARTILAADANTRTAEDSVISQMNQGGFGQTAAQITIDPSINPGVGPGWLDFWGQGFAQVTRFGATFAANNVTLTNASGSAYPPSGAYAPGTFHIANASTGATYTNTASLVIAPNTTTTCAFQADLSGQIGNAGNGQSMTLVTSASKVTAASAGAFVGNNAESNAQYLNRCLLKLGSLSPNGPSFAYQFVALSASQPPFNVPPLDGGRITRVLVTLNTSTGVVYVTLANAAGPVDNHDVGLIQTAISQYVTPDAVSSVAQSATGVAATFALHAWVPTAYAGSIGATLQNAILEYVATLPIGGIQTSDGPTFTHALPINGVLGACFEAAPYMTDLTCIINGATGADGEPVDLVMTTFEVITAAPDAFTVTVN